MTSLRGATLPTTPAGDSRIRVGVFCGGSAGNRGEYADAARRLGQEFAQRQIGLVYGGSHLGLMGVLADATLRAGGEAIGVIPDSMDRKGLAHPNLSQLCVVETLSARKTRMAELSDAFLALPGGAGTLDELAEVWALAKLDQHDKPCGLLNTAGFYDPFLAFIRSAVVEGFVTMLHSDLIVVCGQPEDVIDRLVGRAAKIARHPRLPQAEGVGHGEAS